MGKLRLGGGEYNLPKATQPAGGEGGCHHQSKACYLQVQGGAETRRKGLRGQQHTRGGEKGQSGGNSLRLGAGRADVLADHG